MLVKAKSSLLIAAMSLLACGAHAEVKEEWRVLGPAYSHHFSLDGAQFSGPRKWFCEADHIDGTSAKTMNEVKYTTLSTFTVADPRSAVVESHLEGPAVNPGTFSKDGEFFYIHDTGSGIASAVYCGRAAYGDEQVWTQKNPAIGLEKSWRYDDGHVDKAFGNLVTDSYGSRTFMVGVGRQWPIANAWGLSVDAGLAAGLWARSQLASDNTLYRSVVPFVLPTASIQESWTGLGLGLNLALAPKLKINDRIISSTTTVMVQMTFLINASETSPRLSVQSDAGGMTATYSRFF